MTSYDGETRSSILHSQDYIMYLVNNFGGSTKVVVAKRGESSLSSSNKDMLNEYVEMDYSGLTSELNLGAAVRFMAKIADVEMGMMQDVLTLQLADGHTLKAFHTLMFYPEAFAVGEEYTFYGLISEASDGEFQLYYAQPAM